MTTPTPQDRPTEQEWAEALARALCREVCPCASEPDGTHVPDVDMGCGWALALCCEVLASDWLEREREAARAEERERIAQAIEAERRHMCEVTKTSPGHPTALAYLNAARLARTAGDDR